VDGETTALLGCLDNQREHVIGILEGLSAEALRRPVLPSGWTCLGLVQHLALDVERFWFLEVAGGHPSVIPDDDGSSAWVVSADTSPASVFDLYRREIERANAVIAATPLDAEPRAWPAFFGEWRLADLRAIVLHVVAETACHAGHLDAARELIDGRTWMIVT
jgi:hypothetical protein